MSILNDREIIIEKVNIPLFSLDDQGYLKFFISVGYDLMDIVCVIYYTCIHL